MPDNVMKSLSSSLSPRLLKRLREFKNFGLLGLEQHKPYRRRASDHHSKMSLVFESLEPRQLLAGLTFADSFVTDTVGSIPAIQSGDTGQSWSGVVGTPNVGTGSGNGVTAPGVDIGGASQWVRFDGTGEEVTGVFTELSSLNGSTIEFDYFAYANSTSGFSSSGVLIEGEAGELFRLELSSNVNNTPSEISVPFEIIVNGQSTGVTGPIADAWSHLRITLNEFDWDLNWQEYAVAGGETTSLTGSVSTIENISYLMGAAGGATGVTFSDDGSGTGGSNGLMFVSNVETNDANDAVLALNDFITTDMDTNVTFNVLDNDIDDDSLTISSFTQPASGTLSSLGAGSFSYIPNAGFDGPDQFDYTTDDGSGVVSTATAYVYTSPVTGLPAYASNPNAPAVLFLDFDGDSGDDPFNRAGDLTSFDATEQELIRQSIEYITQTFSMFDVNVTTVLTPDLPKAWIRIRSNGSGGAAYVGSFPNSTSRGWVSSSDRNLTTGLAHEFGHILSITHQSTFSQDGSQTAEYRSNVDGEGSIMGVDFSGNVVKWWWGHYRSQPTRLQNDLVGISNEISNNSASVTGFSADDHASSVAFATPASFNDVSGVWSAGGVINDLDDVDTFVFDWAGGDVDVSAFRVDPFTNSNRGDPSTVDLVLSIFDIDGNLVGFSNPDSYLNNSGLDTDVTIPDLPAGAYVVSVTSHGDYADIGTYSLSVEAGNWAGSDPTNLNSLVAPTPRVIWLGGDSVGLSWSDGAGETGYSIERSENNVDFVEIGNAGANQTSFVDAGGLDYTTQYFYRIRAEQSATVSLPSDVVDATTRPGAVTNFTVSDFIGNTKVLNWKVQRTSGETGFRIERSTDGVNFAAIATVEANRPSYSDTSLDSNLNYDYRIITLDSLGDAAIAVAGGGLIARYTFGDTTAIDSSVYGNNNSGSLTNGAAVIDDSGRKNNVLSLDGTDDYVAIGNSSNINLGTQEDRTISVSFTADSTSGQSVIYEEGGATAGYNIYIDNGLLYVGAWGMNNSVANVFLSTPITSGQWYDVSLVNDFSTTTITGYLNGSAFGSGASDSMPEHTGEIALGRISGATRFHTGSANSSGSYFDGLIDEVKIYNSVNSANEVPVASDDAVIVDNDESVVISVLANDSDADGDGLVVASVIQPSNGAVVVNQNGTVTYTPVAGYFGGDSFSYSASDNQGGTHTATVNLTVNSTGLIARYNFDGGTVSDSSSLGRDNSGSLNNGATVIVDGFRGNVLSLDGVDDFVAVSDSQDINNLVVTDRTISLSFKADETVSRQVIYEEGGATRGFNVYIESGLLYVGVWGMDGMPEVFLSRVVSAEWQNVSVVLDSRLEKITASLNGYVLGTAAGGSMATHTGNIGIGAARDATRFHTGNVSGDGSYFSGLIENLRIYNSVAINAAPTALADGITLDEDGQIAIAVLANDSDDDGDFLQVIEVSQGANGSVVINADGTVTYTPSANFYGDDSFTYTIVDGFGGSAMATVDISINSVPDGLVSGRFVYYGGSSFGGTADRDAITPDKTALLPGVQATFDHYTSYSKGINGIIVDVSSLPSVPTASDFVFRVGNTNTPSNWDVLTVAPVLEFTAGAGASGADQIKLTWADNTIEKQWLQVTLLANTNTDLNSNDVFYFGNAIGESGNDSTDAIVDLADVGLTRVNQSGFGSVGIESDYDYNRDGRVDLVDLGIARTNQSGFDPLILLNPPSGGGSGFTSSSRSGSPFGGSGSTSGKANVAGLIDGSDGKVSLEASVGIGEAESGLAESGLVRREEILGASNGTAKDADSNVEFNDGAFAVFVSVDAFHLNSIEDADENSAEPSFLRVEEQEEFASFEIQERVGELHPTKTMGDELTFEKLDRKTIDKRFENLNLFREFDYRLIDRGDSDQTKNRMTAADEYRFRSSMELR